jgi:hypothetical protein
LKEERSPETIPSTLISPEKTALKRKEKAIPNFIGTALSEI